MTTFLTIILAVLLAAPFGSNQKPVTARHHMEQISADTVRLTFDLTIDDGWHVYSTNLEGGPIAAELTFDASQGVTPASELRFKGNEKDIFDPMFNMSVRYFENYVTFYQDFAVSEGWSMEGSLTYGTCNDINCLPPQRIEFSHTDTHAEASAPELDANDDLESLDGFDRLLWAPVSYENADAVTGNSSLS